MTTPKPSPHVYSHPLMQLPPAGGSRWRVGYLAEPASEPGMIRVGRAVAAQIVADMHALRAETLALVAESAQFYEDAIGEVDGEVPRIDMDGEHLVADWRLVAGDSDALRVTDPDPDGRYTLGLGLGWQQVSAEDCDTVRDDTTLPSPVAAAYEAYVACFISPAEALLEFAHRAGIAVAWLDRSAIEADSRPLTDNEWQRIRDELYQYHEHVCGTDELNSLFLDQIFADAGIERVDKDADHTR